ncbi:MAG: formylglycine-generating enzyme family protein [Rhodospirillaceae bacterium]|nr:formylglycine-generating enzyme family protein [Rhodospirillaceae bacterium]
MKSLVALALWALALWALPAAAQVQAFRDCADCPEMVRIPSGSFVMGSADTEADRETNEGPQRTVTIARPFALGRTEVTVGQFAAFVAATGYQAANACADVVAQRAKRESPPGNWRAHGFAQTDDHPVACLSRADALAYIAWLSNESGKSYRLPSEAEWEYAARAGAPAPDTVGICRRANVADQALLRAAPHWPPPFAECDDGHAFTAPVASYAANAFGLFDMAGNLWEFTADCYAERYPDAPVDGGAYVLADCPRHTVRGGGWLNGPGPSGGDGEHRPANRGRNSPGAHFDSMGFRLARDLP